MHDVLRRVLRRSFDGGAWHGPALADALDGVSAEAAAARPVAHGHTIAELVHHLTAWTREVTRRMGGAAPAMPIEGDWPDTSRVIDDAEWKRLRAELAAARDALLAALDGFPAERLPARVDGATEADEGMTFADTLVGLAEHNAYHGGQIVLLARALDGTPSAGAGPPPDPATITES